MATGVDPPVARKAKLHLIARKARSIDLRKLIMASSGEIALCRGEMLSRIGAKSKGRLSPLEIKQESHE